jgi:hypothetical protein
MRQLEINEGRVFGARYWTVKPVPNWDPAGDWGGINTWNNMVEWCVKTFGPTAKDGVFTPSCRWYVNNAKFWFRTEADRDWFLLRWQ